jgi:hypothetical protein
LQKTFDISYNKVLVDNVQVSLPYQLISEKEENGKWVGRVLISRTPSGICLQLNKGLQVCCNLESKSCSVALTRWFTGRINGLLGQSNTVNRNFQEAYWQLGGCTSTTATTLSEPTDKAIKSCYMLFGDHRSIWQWHPTEFVRISGRDTFRPDPSLFSSRPVWYYPHNSTFADGPKWHVNSFFKDAFSVSIF